MGIVALTVIVIGWVAAIAIVDQTAKRKRDAEEQSRKLAETTFNRMSAREHLGRAAAAAVPGSSQDEISEGLRNLEAIPQSSAEASEAKFIEQQLFKARALANKRELEKKERERLAALSPRELASEQTKLVDFSWTKEGFGNVMIANFTIRNDSPYAIKDLKIRCEHTAPSGTVIDSNTGTIYDIVKAGSTRTFASVNMGFIASQAAQSACRIVGLEVSSIH